MSNPLLQSSLFTVDRQEQCGRSPNLAILGPPGSGKSLFLKELLKTIEDDPRRADSRCLMLDLYRLPVCSQSEFYAHLNDLLLGEAARVGIVRDLNVKTEMPHLRFKLILGHLLKSVRGSLIIFIDHLERVPLMYSSHLSHCFRGFLEITDPESAYQKLGLVIAGAVSLYDLKHGENSAFQMLEFISFPPLDPLVRRFRVENYLQTYTTAKVSPEMINVLADLTGGEPGFLRPLSVQLGKANQQACFDETQIKKALETLCLHSQNQVLRHLALHFWGDEDLREIVKDLNDLKTVEPRSAVPDIDRFQLSGAVVLNRDAFSNSVEYQFRNGITAQFLNLIHTSLQNRDGQFAAKVALGAELEKLEAARTGCLGAKSTWDWVQHLLAGWQLMLRLAPPNIRLYVTQQGLGSGWWFDATNQKVSGPETREVSERSEKTAAFSALDNISMAFSGESEKTRGFVESDAETISIALPLWARDVIVVLVATLSRTDAGRGLTEFELCHWLRFLHNVKQVLPNLVLAELGQRVIQELQFEKERRPVRLTATAQTEKHSPKYIYLLPRGDALIKSARVITTLPTGISAATREDLNNRCLSLIESTYSYLNFEDKLNGIAHQMEISLKTEAPELLSHLNSDSPQLVIASHKDDLMIPFELFPRGAKYLATLTALSRQIIGGYRLPEDVSRSISSLFESLASNNEDFRVLLVASVPSTDLPNAQRELTAVSEHIKAGCRKIKVTPVFTKILSDDATPERLEQELSRNRPYHWVHYSGHGRYYFADKNASGVVLTGADGLPQAITYKRLNHWFEGAGVWLCYLSCCHGSSSQSTGNGISPKYAGTLDAIVSAGVPNAVGFRSMVSDESAFYLADEFYRQLFEVQTEKNLSLAMLEARRVVETRSDSFDAWASSILITQYS